MNSLSFSISSFFLKIHLPYKKGQKYKKVAYFMVKIKQKNSRKVHINTLRPFHLNYSD